MLSGFTWTHTTAANCCGETASTITPSSGVWEGLKRGEEVKEGRKEDRQGKECLFGLFI